MSRIVLCRAVIVIDPSSTVLNCFYCSANCKAQDVFSFVDHANKYGKLTKPAFIRAMKEAQDATAESEDSKSSPDEVGLY